MSEAPKCQCPMRGVRSALADAFGYEPEEEKAREHEPSACPGDYGLALYERNGQRLWLCSCCTYLSDKRLTDSRGLTEVPR